MPSCNSEVQENNTDIQKAKHTHTKTHSSRNSVVVCLFVLFFGVVVMVVFSVLFFLPSPMVLRNLILFQIR